LIYSAKIPTSVETQAIKTLLSAESQTNKQALFVESQGYKTAKAVAKGRFAVLEMSKPRFCAADVGSRFAHVSHTISYAG